MSTHQISDSDPSVHSAHGSTSSSQSSAEQGKQAVKEQSFSGIKALARFGYAARGVVYLIVGGLALFAAVGSGGEVTGTKGALGWLAQQPWGKVLLGLVALGLIGHAVWRFVQAVRNTDGHSGGKGVVIRIGLFVAGLTNLALASWAGSVALGLTGSSGSGSGDGKESWTAWLLNQPGGVWWVGLIGAAVIGAGVAQIVKAHKEKFEDHLKASGGTIRKLKPVCKFGLDARGVTLGIIGGFFIYAAVTLDPSEAGGLAQVFAETRQAAFGTVLLALIAAGLIAFAIYSFIEAGYRRVNPR